MKYLIRFYVKLRAQYGTFHNQLEDTDLQLLEKFFNGDDAAIYEFRDQNKNHKIAAYGAVVECIANMRGIPDYEGLEEIFLAA
tara:strand:- start:253 stop:501 length:249 start_codon:yes stop_codon:yes gene_type:complete